MSWCYRRRHATPGMRAGWGAEAGRASVGRRLDADIKNGRVAWQPASYTLGNKKAVMRIGGGGSNSGKRGTLGNGWAVVRMEGTLLACAPVRRANLPHSR